MSPRRSSLPRTAGAALVLALPVLAGCGAGQNTAMEQQRTTPYVASATVGSIAVRAVRLVVADSTNAASASPAAAGVTPSSGPQAYLMATVVNRGSSEDALTNATVTGGSVQPIGGDPTGLALPGGAVVRFGDPDLGDTGTTLGVSGLSAPLVPGTTASVTMTFQAAGTVTLEVPVQTSSDVGTTASAAPVVPSP